MTGNISGIRHDTWSSLDYQMSELEYVLQTIQTIQTNHFIFFSMEELRPRVDKIKRHDVYNAGTLFIIWKTIKDT